MNERHSASRTPHSAPRTPHSPRSAVFLDRDGVMNRERDDFVKSMEEFELFPQAVRAAAKLSRHRMAVVVISNQSGIARGLVSAEVVSAMMSRLKEAVLAEGGRIDAIYHCPHGPGDSCECRKPLPGMFLQAAQELNLDLLHSIVVGDSERDLAAGKAAGCGACVLVLTGKVPPESGPVWTSWKTPPNHVAPTLEAAVPWILERISLAPSPEPLRSE